MSTEGWHNRLNIGTANPNGDPRDGFFNPTLTLMIYPRDTRPEFKMWGGASKTSVCFSGYKSISKALSCLCNKIYPAMRQEFLQI